MAAPGRSINDEVVCDHLVVFGWSDGERREIDDHHTLQLVDVATATGAWDTMRDIDAPAAPEDLSNALDCNPIARHSLDAFSPSA